MADIDYFALLKKSWLNFKDNLVVVVPILISIALGIGFLLLVGIEALIFFLVFSKTILINPKVILSPIGISLAAVFIILDFIVGALIGSYIRSMMIGMFKDIVLYKKTSVSNMFAYGRKYIWRYFKVSLLIIAISVLPLVFLTGISTLVFLISKIAGIIVIVLSVLILTVFFIFLMFFLFFVDPIFATEDKAAFEIIKSSFRYTKKNFAHVFFTWGVSGLVYLAINGGLRIMMLPFGFMVGFGSALSMKATIASMIVGGFVGIISTIINIASQLVLSLFQFNSYFAKNELHRIKKLAKV